MNSDRLKDRLRSFFHIRVRRRLDPVGRKPGVGARLILNGMRMRVESSMSDDAWQWLVLQGWRECRYRADRRRYVELPKGTFDRLQLAQPMQRERTHRRIVKFVAESRRYSQRTA